MEYLYSLFEIIATLSESAIILYAISSLFESRFNKKVQILIVTMSYICINFLMILFNNIVTTYSGALDLLLITLYTAVSIGFYKGSFFFRAILPIILLIVIAIINISVNILMSVSLGIDSEILMSARDPWRVLSLFITKFVFLLVVQFGVRKMKNRDIALKLGEWIGIIVVFVVSLLIIIAAAEIQLSKADRNLNMIVLIYGMAIINIVTFVFVNKMAKKNKDSTMLKMMQVQEKEQRKAFESIEKMYSSMRILKHDIKNEWIVVYQALKSGQDDYAKEIAKKMIDSKIESLEEHVKISNPSVNAVLNYKLNMAKQKGVHITSYVQDDFDCFDDYDIVMLISNLLDNAIEASETVSNPDIDIMITTKMNYLSIIVANRVEKSVLKGNKKLKTTKQDTLNHGLGTKSIRQICEKYSGMIDYYEKDDMFIADVLLKKETPIIKEKLPSTN